MRLGVYHGCHADIYDLSIGTNRLKSVPLGRILEALSVLPSVSSFRTGRSGKGRPHPDGAYRPPALKFHNLFRTLRDSYIRNREHKSIYLCTKRKINFRAQNKRLIVHLSKMRYNLRKIGFWAAYIRRGTI